MIAFTKTSYLAALGAVLCSGACSSGSNDAQAAASKAQQEPDGTAPAVYRLSSSSAKRHGIAVQAVAVRPLRRHFVAPARVTFDQRKHAHVSTPLQGRIVDVPVTTGTVVAKGDTLLVIESPALGEAQLDYVTKCSAAEAAAPLVTLANESWQQGRALYEESQGLSLAEVRRREAALRAAEATAKGARAAASAARHRLALLDMTEPAIAKLQETGTPQQQLVITAPFDGAVIERDVTLGELVSPDDAALLTIADPAVLWVIASVPEMRIGQLTVGSMARVRALGDRVLEGCLTNIAAQLDERTRTIPVRIEVRDAADSLLPGMFVQADLFVTPTTESGAQALSVAETAIQTVDRRSVVFLPHAQQANTFVMRPVEVGKPVDGFVPVLRGLTAGEQVVTEGSFILKAQATQVGPAQDE